MSAALRFERFLPCLLATLLVTAGTPASIASATDTGSDPKVTFTGSIYHEQRGDVAEITVALSGTDTATVRIAADETDVATVVEDRDADGRVTVLLNTYDGTASAKDGDAVAARSVQNASAPLPVGVYDALACPGETLDCERGVAEATRLTVSERSTDGLRAWVAPRSADFANPSEIRAAMSSGTLTRTDALTRNDTLVLELRASGLDGALAARNGENATARFFGLLEDESMDLDTVQINPGPSIPPKEIHLAEHDSARVVTDPANDSYYLVADLSDANVTGRGGELREGDVYEANVSLVGSSDLTSNGTESVTAEFEVVESRETTVDPTTADPETSDAATPSPTASTADAPMREATSESTAATTDEAESTDPGGDEGVPGFGVDAALVAVVAAALLARGRGK